MANNRMILVCNACRLIGSTAPLYGRSTKSGSLRRGKGIFVLAKWYPSSGWGHSGRDKKSHAGFSKRLDRWLNRHRHECVGSDEYRFRLEYEA